MVKLQTLDLEGNQIGEQLGLEQVDMIWHAIRAIHVMYATLCNIDLERAVGCRGIKTSKLSEHHFSQGKGSTLSPNVFRRTSPKVGQVFHANSDIGEYDKFR